MRNLVGTTLAFTLAAATTPAGHAATPDPGIAKSPVTIHAVPGFAHGARSITIQPSGSATVAYDTVPPQTFAVTLAPALTSKLYRDLGTAMPLSALPKIPSFNPWLVVSVRGQTSPNIVPAKGGIEHTLFEDVQKIMSAFPNAK